MSKLINAFDPKTRVFTQRVKAPVNPEEDGYFKRAFTTDEELPSVPDGYAARRTGTDVYGDAWELVEDYVGKTYWIGDAEHTMSDYGPLPDGATLIAPVRDVNLIEKASAVRYLKANGWLISFLDVIEADRELKALWDAEINLSITDSDVTALAPAIEAITGQSLQTMFNEAAKL